MAPRGRCHHPPANAHPSPPQILAVQCLFYVSLAFLMLLAFGAPNAATPHPSLEPRGALTQPCGAGPLAPNLSLALLFDYTRVSAHSLLGWCARAARPPASRRSRLLPALQLFSAPRHFGMEVNRVIAALSPPHSAGVPPTSPPAGP